MLDTMMEEMKAICFAYILISYCQHDLVFIFSITVSNTMKPLVRINKFAIIHKE